jgi:hypothetical protein
LCADELDATLKVDQSEISEICSWCGEGGDLFACGDGESCPHCFCEGCIANYLGAEYLDDLRASDEDWTCFVCDSSNLKRYSDALLVGMERSMYHGSMPIPKVKSEGTAHEDDEEEEDDDDEIEEKTEEQLDAMRNDETRRLKVLIEESQEAASRLEPEVLQHTREDIEAELKASKELCGDA